MICELEKEVEQLRAALEKIVGHRWSEGGSVVSAGIAEQALAK